MRKSPDSASACSSHIERSVASEFENTSQGASSRPSIRQLNEMSLALIFICWLSCENSGCVFPEILEQREERLGRGGRHEMSGVDDLEPRTWNLLGDALGDWNCADGVLPSGYHQRRALNGFEAIQKIGAGHHAEGMAEADRIIGEIA